MNIKVCIGEYCHLKRAEDVVKAAQACLKANNLEGAVDLKGCFCMGRCQEDGVSVQIDEDIHKVDAENAEEFFQKLLAPSA